MGPGQRCFVTHVIGLQSAPRYHGWVSAQRIGDSDRDAAIAALREHMSAGRLTAEEFDERMTKALEAKFQQDLEGLFIDLPGGVPSGQEMVPLAGGVLAAQPANKAPSLLDRIDKLRMLAIPAIWILFVVGMIFRLVPWWSFWIVLIATGAIAGNPSDDKFRPGKRKELED